MIAARRLAPQPALTRYPLPDHDATIDALSPGERMTAAAIWLGRAEAELRASSSFTYLTRTLSEAGAAPDLVALSARAVADEQRHAALCWRVACAFAGRELPPARRLPLRVPALPEASPALRRVLHVIGMSCLNETTGTAFLECCRAGARGPLVRAALRELLADEIDHARIGWAFAASSAVDAGARAEIAAWLPRLVEQNLAAWRDRPRQELSDALVAQGCPRWDDVDAAVHAALEQLVRPGFEHVGLRV